MPPLQWLGRKWRTGSDDFLPSSLLSFSLLSVSAALTLTRFAGLVEIKLKDCVDVPQGFERCVYAIGIMNSVSALLYLATAVISCRGTPFQVSKRRHVSTLLYFTSLFAVASLILCSIVTKYAVYDDYFSRCGVLSKRLMYVSLVFNFFVSVLHIFSMILAYDPVGNRSWRSAEDYEVMWSKRFRLMCCCCFSSKDEEDVFRDAARTLAAFFQGYDLVPSDVFAGMILLHDAQRQALLGPLESLEYPPACDGYEERISSQACKFPVLSDAQRRCVFELQYYSRFFMATYGCLLYTHMHFCTSLPTLCCRDPCMCCRRHAGVHRGAGCYCDLTAALKMNGLSEEDVIFANWKSNLFHPVFYVAVVEEKDSVVVAIRGTLSFADCITDVTASPEVLSLPTVEEDAGAPTGDYYAHGGMKRSAEYVLNELQQSGVLDDVLRGRFRSQKLVVLGHSLGAGVATVLSIMLSATEPSLRGRLMCLAYSPPGGLLSPSLVEYSKEFIVGCFVGNDVIPRTATHTFDGLRESVLDALERCTVSKAALFFNRCVFNRGTSRPAPPESSVAVRSKTVREKLRSRSCPVPLDQRRLFPPSTLVHLRKAVVRKVPSACLCISCCCCTRRENMFVPVFETPDDVQTVLCSPSMFIDHFPDRVFDILEETVCRLRGGELDRFFSPNKSDLNCEYIDSGDVAFPDGELYIV